jgi:outer membrane protein, heavy metal efflux system
MFKRKALIMSYHRTELFHKKHEIICIAVLIVLLLIALALPARAEALTLTRVLGIALERNPNLKAAKTRVEEAYYAYRASSCLPNPTANLNFIGGNNTVHTYNALYEDAYVSFEQSFGSFGSTALSGKAGFQSYEMAQLDYKETEISLVKNIKDGFYTLLCAQEQKALAEENLTLSRELCELVEKRYNAGAVPRSDLLNAEIQKATMEQGLIQADGALNQAQSALNALLGRAASDPLEVNGSLDLCEIRTEYQVLLSLAEKNRPLMKSARKAVELGKTQVELARTQSNPVVNVSYTCDLVTTPLYNFGLAIQAPIFDYGGIRNQVRAQKTAVKEKEHAAAGTLLSISSTVKSAYDSYQAAYKNMATFREKVMLPSEKLMKIMQFGYTKGALPYMQVLTRFIHEPPRKGYISRLN